MKFMKIFFLMMAFSISIISCMSVRKDPVITGTIVRDCSETYFRISENTDYLVCKNEILKDKKDREKVYLAYELTQECPKRDGKIRCMLYHENKGMIRILSLQ